MYDDYDAENDTFSQTNVLGQIGEHAVVVVGEDVKQMVCLQWKCCHCPIERTGPGRGRQ